MTDANITLRLITANDAGFLHELCGHPWIAESLAIGPHPIEYWRKAIEAWSADHDEEAYIIQRKGCESAIGWMAINGLQGHDGTAWIKVMTLSPAEWHHGYCRACMATVKDMLSRRGFLRARLWIDVDNMPSIRCCEASGFKRIKEERGPVGDPAVERLRAEYECRLN